MDLINPRVPGAVLPVLPHKSFSDSPSPGPAGADLGGHMAHGTAATRIEEVNPREKGTVCDSPERPQCVVHYLRVDSCDHLGEE